MSENHLSTEGCELLKETLKQNTSITHLTMQGNRFDDVTAVVWAEIISVGQISTGEVKSPSLHLKEPSFVPQNTIKIEYLDLSHNEFGEEAGKLLGPAIAENNSIRYMDLSWNNLRRKGAIAIAKGLGVSIITDKLRSCQHSFSIPFCLADKLIHQEVRSWLERLFARWRQSPFQNHQRK